MEGTGKKGEEKGKVREKGRDGKREGIGSKSERENGKERESSLFFFPPFPFLTLQMGEYGSI